MATRATARRRKEPEYAKPGLLNSRQSKYLELVYHADQEAEEHQRRQWHQHGRRDPADQWRWIAYATDHPQAAFTGLQQSLVQAGMHDPGAGATFAALIRRGLLETRTIQADTPHGPARQRQVRLTRAGRRAARENKPARSPALCGLPPWLEDALSAVRNASPPGLPKTSISRRAARRLGPAGYHYIDDANAWAYKITSKGVRYLTHQAGSPGSCVPATTSHRP
jgi:hypothetical protein